MNLLLSTLLSSLLPVGAEGIKQLIISKAGGVKPTTVEEQIKLDNNDIERIKAVAALDNPGGTPSQWVVDLRASSRYLAAWGCIVLGSGMIVSGIVQPRLAALSVAGTELVSVAFGFLFGTRLVANFNKK